ncbi:MAG: DMT family transporter [Xanthobacteraceae bacterium]
MDDAPTAILLALASTLGYGVSFVLAQFGLRWMSPRLGAAFSVPTGTLLFWLVAPFSVNLGKVDAEAVVLFTCVGLFFPAAVTLLNFESNRLLGPNVAGAVSGLAPLFAVLLALVLLDERLRPLQIFGISGIVVGVMLMYRGQRQNQLPWPQSLLFLLPLAAAAVRGGVQPVVKLGLTRWPDPLAALVLGYTVSSAVLIGAAFLHNPGVTRRVNLRGALWFAALGVCNGSAVLLTYAALNRGPVTLVSPLIASYPLVTLFFSFVFLKHEPIRAALLGGVAATVAGIILVIVG